MSTEIKTTSRLLFFPQLKERGVLLCRRHIDNLEMQGNFPKRVRLSEWRVAWVAEEIDAWVAAKMAARAIIDTKRRRRGPERPRRPDLKRDD